MRIKTGINNQGIYISADLNDTPDERLEPHADADQGNPRKSYVYAHLDDAGNIFYVGKGTGRRAWSTDRHPLHERYIKDRLGGKFSVKILQDNLSTDDAEGFEARWIEQYAAQLVNWVNAGRPFDYAMNLRHRKLVDDNRAAIRAARSLEASSKEAAAAAYIIAISNIKNYAFLTDDSGIVGELFAAATKELGYRGELVALDRLTLCLVKLGRAREAQARMQEYFSLYRRDQTLTAAEPIRKRVEKALAHEPKLAA